MKYKISRAARARFLRLPPLHGVRLLVQENIGVLQRGDRRSGVSSHSRLAAGAKGFVKMPPRVPRCARRGGPSFTSRFQPLTERSRIQERTESALCEWPSGKRCAVVKHLWVRTHLVPLKGTQIRG
jgi:hypothetical protein